MEKAVIYKYNFCHLAYYVWCVCVMMTWWPQSHLTRMNRDINKCEYIAPIWPLFSLVLLSLDLNRQLAVIEHVRNLTCLFNFSAATTGGNPRCYCYYCTATRQGLNILFRNMCAKKLAIMARSNSQDHCLPFERSYPDRNTVLFVSKM